MSKTFADLTPEESHECVGMWGDVQGFTRPTPIVDVYSDQVELVIHDSLSGHQVRAYTLEEVTPRFDLPRVWTPEGKPVNTPKPAPVRANGMVNEHV